MKHFNKTITFLIATIILIQYSSNCLGQVAQSVSPLENFMKYKGVKNLASLAHFFNTYTEGTYSFSGNYITVEVSYRNGHSEVITLHYEQDGDYFESVKSISGEEHAYSFLAAGALINGFSPDKKTCIERFFRTTFKAMSGEQIAAAVLTSLWWDWKGKSCE